MKAQKYSVLGVVLLALFASISSFAAVIQLSATKIRSGNVHAMKAGLKSDIYRESLGYQHAGKTSFITGMTARVATTSNVLASDKLVSSSTGSDVRVTVPRGNMAVYPTPGSCVFDAMLGGADFYVSTTGRPSGTDDCGVNASFCNAGVAVVAHNAACPTTAGSYTSYGYFGAPFSVSSDSRVCVKFDNFSYYNYDATVLLYETKQDASDTYKAYCDCDSLGNCTTGQT